MSVNKKFQLNQSNRLAGYRQHINIYTNVLFYYKYIDKETFDPPFKKLHLRKLCLAEEIKTIYLFLSKQRNKLT